MSSLAFVSISRLLGHCSNNLSSMQLEFEFSKENCLVKFKITWINIL